MRVLHAELMSWPAIALTLLSFALPGFCQGKLDAFKADVNAPAKQSYGGHREHSSDDCPDTFGSALLELGEFAFIYGGVSSWARIADAGAQDSELRPRALGEPLIPFVRLDAACQRIGSDVNAIDLRGELGFGPLGVHVDYTHYRERNPDEGLDLNRIMGLYRMSFGSCVEIDIGLGSLTVDGDHATSRGLVALPVLIHPGEHLGFEFRPAWADRFSDYDAALMWTWGCTSAKFGYRWVQSPDESLNGPYAGLSTRL